MTIHVLYSLMVLSKYLPNYFIVGIFIVAFPVVLVGIADWFYVFNSRILYILVVGVLSIFSGIMFYYFPFFGVKTDFSASNGSIIYSGLVFIITSVFAFGVNFLLRKNRYLIKN